MVALHISGLAGPSQFLNGTHEFSELLLARIVLLVDQSRSVLPLRSAKAREFGKLWWEKCTRAPWTLPLKLARTSSFRPTRSDRWKATYVSLRIITAHALVRVSPLGQSLLTSFVDSFGITKT